MAKNTIAPVARQEILQGSPSPDAGRGCSEGAPPAAGGEGSRSDSLPSLYSNNANESAQEKHRLACILALCGILSPYHKRQAHTLFLNVERLVALSPSIGHLGFFTLTTPDNVKDHSEFRKRWNSFRTGYLSKSPNYGQWIATYERQQRGAWHLHLLVTLPHDVRDGVDFEAFAKGRYRSASPFLRSVWSELREKCPRYKFGRHELLPVKSNAEGIARYIGKYISKHMGARAETDKGKRLVASSSGWVKNSCRFQFFTDGSKEWRRKVEKFAHVTGCGSLEDLYEKFGPNWAYKHLDSIYQIDEFTEHLNKGVPF